MNDLHTWNVKNIVEMSEQRVFNNSHNQAKCFFLVNVKCDLDIRL